MITKADRKKKNYVKDGPAGSQKNGMSKGRFFH